MSRDLVIFPMESGQGILVLHPSSNIPWTIEQLADRDIPAGTPYKFISYNELPEDHFFRAAWTADFSEPDGIALGYDAFTALNTRP
jgi:hypothetical protein